MTIHVTNDDDTCNQEDHDKRRDMMYKRDI